MSTGDSFTTRRILIGYSGGEEEKRNMLFVGTGKNLYSTTKAVYLDADHCRVCADRSYDGLP